MAAASLLISIAAIVISVLAVWKTHFAPFSALAVAGKLAIRIYPIRSGTERWFIASLDVPVSVTNEGARPGVINGLRLRLHFPKIPIPDNCELIKPVFEIAPEDAKYISKDRFEWIDKIVMGDWMPFTVLPKTTVTKHFVFETRWEDPVIQETVNCTLEIRSAPGKWREVTSWRMTLRGELWSHLVDLGGSIGHYPGEAESVLPDCLPPDLHKYTGTKASIPKGGLLAGDSYLDFPRGDEGDGS
jgi:hypothetical protein